MRRMTTVGATIAHHRVDSVHVLIKDSAVSGAELCLYGLNCAPWQCLFGCSNRRRSSIILFLCAAFNGSSDHIVVDASDGRLEAGVVEWLFCNVWLYITFCPDDQRPSSIRPVNWRSVAELRAQALW